MSPLLPPGGEVLLNDLERVTARLSALNPGDFAVIRDALAERALAIECLMAWLAVCKTPFDPDPELALRVAKILATGTQLAVRLTLVGADVRAQIAEMERGKRLLEALTRAGTPFRGLDCNG